MRGTGPSSGGRSTHPAWGALGLATGPIGRLTTLGAELTEALSVNSSTMTEARKGLPVSLGEDGGN